MSRAATARASKKQLGLPLAKQRASWGGRRAGAGRKRTKGIVLHRRRPFHDDRHPVHVTMRVGRAVGNLRRFALAGVVGEAIRAASVGARGAARRRTFRVVHFSIQTNHVHLVVEATSKTALSRGMQGLASRLARRINRHLVRRGPVFRERYHARALATPLEARRAIAYVLTNTAKHADADPIPDLGTAPVDGIDPCSSARWFEGWERPPPSDRFARPTAAPRTWLLCKGWRRHGLLGRDERPAVAS
jgi:REP element-mobilizing transposase RayT